MRNIIFTAVALLLYILAACSSKPEPADMVIFGGTIYTVNEAMPTAEAIVVRGDKIEFVGGEEEARNWVGENTELIDLKGKTLIPGFIEGHGHFMGIGNSKLNLDLMNVKSYDEIVEMVAEAVAEAQPGEWIIGRGWHQDKWDVKPDVMVKGFQTHRKLSDVSPDNPVYLTHASGHASFANAKAMEIAGVNVLVKEGAAPTEVEGGEIIRDEHGNPTGIFNERAQWLISQHIPDNDPERSRRAMELAMEECLSHGITSFHDAGVGQSTIDLFRDFKKEGKLGVRMYLMVRGGGELVRTWLNKGPEIDPDHWLTIRSIKLASDGALGSRGAWLLEPYTDRTDTYGMPIMSMDTLLSMARLALQHGFQVCTHAIGDRANQEVLDRYEIAFKENPGVTDHRFRIEHAQHLHPSDIPRFAELGVIPSMEAIHMSSDRPWAIDRLGEKRIKEGAYMWQTLLKSGAHIVNGTDAPVEPVDPIPSFYASVTRMTLKGEPEGGFEPEEKMTRAQALKSYTLDAAYGAFEEEFKGSIEVGKLADFTVLSKDIMTAADREILNTEVEMTIVGGKIAYKKQ